MGKQTGEKKRGSGAVRTRKRAIEPFTFLGVSFSSIDAETVKKNLFLLILLSVITKVCVYFATVYVFHSFVDTFDQQYYLQSFLNMLSGKIPYADFSFDYPPLAFIPIILAAVPALLFNSFYAFIVSFQFLMTICDAVIVACIYLIGLKIYNEKTALIAAALYATAFSGAYFVLTKFDAFPSALLMVAVLVTVYGMTFGGYIAVITGFLAKIYPVISLPFLFFYNAKTTSLKQEIWSILKICIPVAVIIGVPVVVLRPGIISTYVTGSLVRTDVYVNTPTFTIYTWLHDIFHLGISSGILSDLMYALLGVILIVLVLYAWIDRKPGEKTLVKLLALSIFSTVFCMKYHSPQYILWFLPFVSLLVADSLAGILVFYLMQVIAFLEFPLLFGTLYVNGNYMNDVGTGGWYLTAVFFTIEMVLSIVLMYLAIKPSRDHVDKIVNYFKGFRKNSST
jgi:hypothetical protein